MSFLLSNLWEAAPFPAMPSILSTEDTGCPPYPFMWRDLGKTAPEKPQNYIIFYFFLSNWFSVL
jgi:hypothetical protein